MSEEIKHIKEDITRIEKERLQYEEINSKEHREIKELLTPIADTYRTVNMMGKWLMAVLVFISILLGVILSWTKVLDFFNRK